MSRFVCGLASMGLLLLATAVTFVSGTRLLAASREPVDPLKEPKPGEVRKFEIPKGVEMEFCWIPGGEAQLGSPKAEREEVRKQNREEKESECLAAQAEGRSGRQ